MSPQTHGDGPFVLPNQMKCTQKDRPNAIPIAPRVREIKEYTGEVGSEIAGTIMRGYKSCDQVRSGDGSLIE